MLLNKLTDGSPLVPIVVTLPNGQWCIQYNGLRSASADYSQRIIDTFGRTMLCGQTEYYGYEAVWEIRSIVTHNVFDESLS